MATHHEWDAIYSPPPKPKRRKRKSRQRQQPKPQPAPKPQPKESHYTVEIDLSAERTAPTSRRKRLQAIDDEISNAVTRVLWQGFRAFAIVVLLGTLVAAVSVFVFVLNAALTGQ